MSGLCRAHPESLANHRDTLSNVKHPALPRARTLACLVCYMIRPCAGPVAQCPAPLQLAHHLHPSTSRIFPSTNRARPGPHRGHSADPAHSPGAVNGIPLPGAATTLRTSRFRSHCRLPGTVFLSIASQLLIEVHLRSRIMQFPSMPTRDAVWSWMNCTRSFKPPNDQIHQPSSLSSELSSRCGGQRQQALAPRPCPAAPWRLHNRCINCGWPRGLLEDGPPVAERSQRHLDHRIWRL